MISNNDFNGAHKWNLGGLGARGGGASRHNGVNESGERGGGSPYIYMENQIKEASGSYSFSWLETVWGVHFRVQNSNRPVRQRIVSAGFPPV